MQTLCGVLMIAVFLDFPLERTEQDFPTSKTAGTVDIKQKATQYRVPHSKIRETLGVQGKTGPTSLSPVCHQPHTQMSQ